MSTEFGGVSTLIVGPDDGNFDGVVQLRPDVACPGDRIEVTVTVVNRADVASRFSPSRGLFLASDMMKWPLAQLPTANVSAGAVWSTTVFVTVPRVGPGSYSVGVLVGVGATLTVLDPATARRR